MSDHRQITITSEPTRPHALQCSNFNHHALPYPKHKRTLPTASLENAYTEKERINGYSMRSRRCMNEIKSASLSRLSLTFASFPFPLLHSKPLPSAALLRISSVSTPASTQRQLSVVSGSPQQLYLRLHLQFHLTSAAATETKTKRVKSETPPSPAPTPSPPSPPHTHKCRNAPLHLRHAREAPSTTPSRPCPSTSIAGQGGKLRALLLETAWLGLEL